MPKYLKLQTPKEAVDIGLPAEARVHANPKHDAANPYMKLRRATVRALCNDYTTMLRALKRAGVTVERPSSKLKGEPFTDKDVPAFLHKDYPKQTAAAKPKRRKRVKL